MNLCWLFVSTISFILCQEDCEDPVFGDCGDIDYYDSENECIKLNEIKVDVTEKKKTLNVVDLRSAGNGDAIEVCNEEEGTPCSQYKELGFECVPVWNCRNNIIITDGSGIINPRAVSQEEKENQCGIVSGILDVTDTKCDKTDYVCCRKPDKNLEKCPDIIRPIGDPNQDPTDWSQCGRNASGSLVFTGEDSSYEGREFEAQPGEFPHACIIYRLENGVRSYLGGATLIAPNKVITVAHKFYAKTKGYSNDIRDKIRMNEILVRCGEHNVKKDNTAFPHQESSVEEIIFHPNYDPKLILYNLAILVTEKNFVYQRHIGPVCLPEPEENFDNQSDCWSSGWGVDSFDSDGAYSNTLKKIDMPIVPDNECRDILEVNNLRPSRRAGPSYLCVGGVPNKDTCRGDGGSPHVCFNKNNNYVLVGAVSHGKGCGSEIPASYSNVAGSMCWIDYVMSTVPKSDLDVDLVEADEDDDYVLGLRERGPFDSVNKLTRKQCGDWAEDQEFRMKYL